MSSTDALFTRFEELFRKYLDSKQFFLLTPEELGIEQANLCPLFYYSWDNGDLPSRQMLLEVLQITYPSGTSKFWGSPAALEDHVLESFALALEKLRFEEPKQDAQKGEELIVKFPSIPDLCWEEVSMAFVSDQKIKVKARNHLKKFKFDQIGFEDKRSGKPNRLWFLLQVFSAKGGQLSWQDLSSTGMSPNQVQSNVKRLRRILREFMGIEDDPFEPYNQVKAYQTRFTITGNADVLLDFDED